MRLRIRKILSVGGSSVAALLFVYYVNSAGRDDTTSTPFVERRSENGAKTTKLASSSSSNPAEYDDDYRPILRLPSYSWLSSKHLSAQGNVYLDQYRLHYCKIDKNMGSTMQAIMCYIDDPELHRDFFFNSSWGPGLGKSKCGASTSFKDLRRRFLNKSRSLFKREEYVEPIKHFAIIRHPVARLISGWLDVCYRNKTTELCYGCRRNFECFIKHNYRHIKAHALRQAPIKWHREWHFYPQSWYCNFRQRLNDYHLVRYDRSDAFRQEILEIFRRQNVSTSVLQDVGAQLQHKRSPHATYRINMKAKRLLQKRKDLLDIVVSTYAVDFRKFVYSIDDYQS